MTRILKSKYTAHERRKFYFKLTLQAALLALGIHLIFFLLLRYEPPARNDRQDERSRFVLLSGREFSGGAVTELGRWIDFHNPAAIASSKFPHGYAAADVTRRRVAPPALPVDESYLTIAGDPYPEFSPRSVPVGETKISGGELYSPGWNFAPPIRPIAERAFPCMQLPDGRIVNLELAPEERKVVDGTLAAPSTIAWQLRPGDGRFRFSIVRSSGRPTLDRLAVALGARQIASGKINTSGEITVYWHK